MSENILDIARRVRDLSEAATPGPWDVHQWMGGKQRYVTVNDHDGLVASLRSRDGRDDNAAFIAETRTAALQLAEAVERMAAALRHAADTLNGCECEEAYDALRDLGIPLEEAGDES